MLRKIQIIALGLTLCCLIITTVLLQQPSVPPTTPEPLNDAPKPTVQTASPADNKSTASLLRPSSSSVVLQRFTSAQPSSPFPEKLEGPREIIANGKRYPLREYKALLTPNDPSGSQWWTTATGLPAAWDYGSGSNVIIAVIDSGAALNHEEFTGRWHERSGEKGVAVTEAASDLNCTDRSLAVSASCNNIDDDQDGINDNETGAATVQNPSRLNCTAQGRLLDKSCNLLDDDGNGYVDDWRGWDFNSGEAYVQAGEINPNGGGVDHGTAVAGTAAANGNNGVGIAGVNWSAKILPLQALSDEGSGNTLSVARAIRYAADQGAHVINLSLGSSQEDSYLREAIHYALNKGSIVVAASGNDGCNCISYPARYPEVLAVGATRSDGSVASFSNYGDNIDLAAPGSGMLLPVWTAANQTSAYASGLAGTSFATPYVSGLLASAKAKQPSATWGQLVSNLLQTTDHRSLSLTSPHSIYYGSGYVRADNLMARVSNVQSVNYRYNFTADTSNTLGAAVYDCEGQFPGSRFYEVRNGASLFYTISELTAYNQRALGATITQKGFSCVGLPTDQVGSPRLIDPARELSNTVKPSN